MSAKGIKEKAILIKIVSFLSNPSFPVNHAIKTHRQDTMNLSIWEKSVIPLVQSINKNTIVIRKIMQIRMMMNVFLFLSREIAIFMFLLPL